MQRGMNSISWYDQLSTGDVEKFESNLIQWAENCKSKNAVMIFNKSSLDKMFTKIANKKMFLISDYYVVNLPTITVEFSCACGEICFLRKVIRYTEKETKTIYTNKGTLKDASLWFAF